MSERESFAKSIPVQQIDQNKAESVDARSGLTDRTQALAGREVLAEVSNGAESIKLSDKAKVAIDVLFAAPKSVAQYVQGKVADFLMEKTPIGALVKTLNLGLSSGLPSDVKQIARGRNESLTLREVVARNVKDSTKQVFSQAKRER